MKNSRVNISAHAHHGTRPVSANGVYAKAMKTLSAIGIEQAAEHGRAVLAGEHAVDPVGAADHGAGDQRRPEVAGVTELRALVDHPRQEWHGHEASQGDLVCRDPWLARA
jgi:hypothetical protein